MFTKTRKSPSAMTPCDFRSGIGKRFILSCTIKNRRSAHTLELVVLIALIVAALIAMQVYFKRGYQGKLRENADDMGKQFSPALTTEDSQTSSVSNRTETTGPEGGTVTSIDETVTRMAKSETPAFDKESWWNIVNKESGKGGGAAGSSGGRPGTSGGTGSGTGTGESTGSGSDTGGGIGAGGGGGSGGGGGGRGGGNPSGGTGTGTGSGTGAGGSADSGDSGSPGPVASDSSVETALEILRDSNNGSYYYDLIKTKGILVTYADFSKIDNKPGVETLGLWIYNLIAINVKLESQCPGEAIASIIAHEATHADYYYNPDKWVRIIKENHPELSDADIHIQQDTIDQEYNAFKQGISVWKEVKNGITDARMDSLQQSVNQGEAYFKSEIRALYEGLPEY